MEVDVTDTLPVIQQKVLEHFLSSSCLPFFCFSRDYSRLGRILRRSLEEDLGIAGARFFYRSDLPFMSPRQRCQNTEESMEHNITG